MANAIATFLDRYLFSCLFSFFFLPILPLPDDILPNNILSPPLRPLPAILPPLLPPPLYNPPPAASLNALWARIEKNTNKIAI